MALKSGEELLLARTEYEFHTNRGLCNEGKKPKDLKAKDVSDRDFLDVWQCPLRKGKINLKFVRPRFATLLYDLLERIYQKSKPTNNEVRVTFARAFAWSNTQRALSNPGQFKVNWASFAAEAFRTSERQISKGETSSYCLNSNAILDHLDKLAEMKRDAEELLLSKQESLLRKEGVVAGADIACKAIYENIQFKQKSREDLERDFPEEVAATAKLKNDEEVMLELLETALLQIDSKGEDHIRAEISVLKDEIASYEASMAKWHAKAKHISAMQQDSESTKTRMELGMGVYSLPLLTSDVCQACGLCFPQEYDLFVKINQCGHKYHVFCFSTVLKTMHCVVPCCGEEVPSSILQELGFKEFSIVIEEDSNYEDEEETELANSAEDKKVKQQKDEVDSSTTLYNKPASIDFKAERTGKIKKRKTRASTKKDSKPVSIIDIDKLSPVKFAHISPTKDKKTPGSTGQPADKKTPARNKPGALKKNGNVSKIAAKASAEDARMEHIEDQDVEAEVDAGDVEKKDAEEVLAEQTLAKSQIGDVLAGVSEDYGADSEEEILPGGTLEENYLAFKKARLSGI